MRESRFSRGAEKSSKVFRYEVGHHISHRELHRSLVESGFAIIKGIPVDNYTSDDARIGATIEFLHGLPFLGVPLKQNSEVLQYGWYEMKVQK